MMKLKGAPTTSFPKKLAFDLRRVSTSTFLAVLFTIVVVWIQTATIFPSGLFDKQGNLVFYNYVLFHDSNVHLSLIAELSHRFPPTNFAVGGGELKNYHYLFDVGVAILHRASGISILDLYFRIVPILLSFLLCLVIYKTIYVLTKNRLASAFGIFFTVFATSWGAVMPLVKSLLNGQVVNGGSNLFMTDQLINMLVNPQGQLSIIVFLALFLLLYQYEVQKKVVFLVFFSLLLGLSFGIKAYGGIVFAPAALAASIFLLVRNKDWRPLAAIIAGLAIMIIWILINIDRGVAGLQFAPFWTLDHMMSDLDKLNEPRFLLLKETSLAIHSWWRVAILSVFSLVAYIIGSSGLRILGFLAIFKLVMSPQKISASIVFLLTGAFVSLTIPIFFNQTKKAYDVVQFTPYFTVFMGIMFSLGLFIILDRLKIKFVQLVLLVATILSFLLLDIREISPRRQPSTEKIVISQPVMAAMDYIQRNTPSDAIFLLAPSEFNRSYLWFSSLSQRRTAYSGLDFAFQTGRNTDKDLNDWQTLFAGENVPVIFNYIYVPKREEWLFAKIKERYHLQPVFTDSEVQILKKIP